MLTSFEEYQDKYLNLIIIIAYRLTRNTVYKNGLSSIDVNYCVTVLVFQSINELTSREFALQTLRSCTAEIDVQYMLSVVT